MHAFYKFHNKHNNVTQELVSYYDNNLTTLKLTDVKKIF